MQLLNLHTLNPKINLFGNSVAASWTVSTLIFIRWTEDPYILYHYFFVLNMSSLLFTSASYIQVHFRLDFFKETNNMNPDQSAPLRAVWSGYIGYLNTQTEEKADDNNNV